MKVYGGRAGYNSVSLTGERYQTITRFKKGKITTEIRAKRENMKITVILSKVPFVRSFSMVLELLFEYWKRFSIALISLFLLDVFFLRTSNSYQLHSISVSYLEMLLFFLVLAGFVIKIGPIGCYHSAEHMVIKCYERNLGLTIDNVKKQPRTHKDCGTSLATSVIISLLILSMLFDETLYVFLISWILGFEIWKTEPKFIWGFILVVSKALQYLLFTSQPKERHLMVAMEAMKRLQEIEMAND